jgi:hypothetical protein
MLGSVFTVAVWGMAVEALASVVAMTHKHTLLSFTVAFTVIGASAWVNLLAPFPRTSIAALTFTHRLRVDLTLKLRGSIRAIHQFGAGSVFVAPCFGTLCSSTSGCHGYTQFTVALEAHVAVA